MPIALSLVFMTFSAFSTLAQDSTDTGQAYKPSIIKPAGSSDLNEFVWKNRLLVVFGRDGVKRLHKPAPWDVRMVSQPNGSMRREKS